MIYSNFLTPASVVLEGTAGDPGNRFAYDVGKVKVLADFAKAAYDVQPWEVSAINDPSPGAAESWQRLQAQGWQPVALEVDSVLNEYSFTGDLFTVQDKMEQGFYTHANAAALVARQGDALVLSFRGTNDADEKSSNPEDPNDQFHPDKDHWDAIEFFSDDTMLRHYSYYTPLFTALNQYLKTEQNVKQLYVTGHSMGGAMAIQFMEQMRGQAAEGQTEAVVFAAAPFINDRNFGVAVREDFADNARVLQIEIAEDPVVKSWDLAGGNNRPGQVIRLYGDQTLDRPDLQKIFFARDANHSMDYYQQMAQRIDLPGWQQILEQASLTRVTDVLVGGQQLGDSYIVAENDDVLDGTGFDVIYGGEGADQLTGSGGVDDLLGSAGNDTLNGEAGADRLYGGMGQDRLYGGADNDQLHGAAGSDLLYGGTGDDWLSGGAGNDTLAGELGDDQLHGGAGNDQLHAQGNDRIHGGAGIDTLVLEGSAAQYSRGSDSSSGQSWMTLSRGQETVRFEGIEKVAFQDRTVAISDLFTSEQVVQQFASPDQARDVDFSVPEGETIFFLLELNAPLNTDVQLAYHTVDGTAVAGRDYQAMSGYLRLEAGQTHLAVEVALIDDDVQEADETFSLVVETPAGVDGSSQELIAHRTITDDDLFT